MFPLRVLACGGSEIGIAFARVSAEIRKMLSQEDTQPLFPGPE